MRRLTQFPDQVSVIEGDEPRAGKTTLDPTTSSNGDWSYDGSALSYLIKGPGPDQCADYRLRFDAHQYVLYYIG